MPYRQPAQAPKSEPRAVERLSVSRYGVLPAIAIVLGCVALVAAMLWGTYARSDVVCTRASAGATPRCSATQRTGMVSSSDVKTFDLKESSLSIEEREWRVFFGEGIYTDDEEEAAVLRAMPEALRKKVLDSMKPYGIRHLGVWETETCLGSSESRAIDAMIDLAIDVAEYATTAVPVPQGG